jgi:hypothetical protein
MIFKFERALDKDGLREVFEHYETVFNRYFEDVFNKKIAFTIQTSDIGSLEGVFIYSRSLRVRGIFENERIFQFDIYSQNNCCGAKTISGTVIDFDYRRAKIGEILQYLKEDIALYEKISMMTCTDVFIEKCDENFDFTDVKPYLPNTKLLLKTGWKVSDMFYNRKSKNVVALYTKKINQLDVKKEVIMEIKLEEKKVVKIEDVTIGADPELFLRSKDTGEYVPSFFIIQGDKHNPTMISEEGHNIQCDNVMVEYGIPPSKTADEFVKNNLFVQDYLEEKVCKPNGLRLEIFPAVNFDPNNLMDERAKQFG